MKHEEFVKSLALKTSTIKCVGVYRTNETPIECRCLLCGYIFKRTPQAFRQNWSCPNCIKKEKIKKSLDDRKRNFLCKLNKIHPNLELIDEYIDSTTEMKFRCKICNHVFISTASRILKMKSHCPECSKFQKCDDNFDFDKEFEKYRDRLEVVSDISNITLKQTSFIVRCKNDGYEWETNLSKLNKRKGVLCPLCSSKIIVVGHNDIWTTNTRVAKLLCNPKDGYLYTQHSNVIVDFKCPCCGSILRRSINNVSNYGLKCPNCNDGLSYGEKIIRNILLYKNIEFEMHKTFLWSNKKEYDFYINNLALIIEVNGGQHYNDVDFFNSTAESQKMNDQYKMELAKQNGIKNYIVLDFSISSRDKNIVRTQINELLEFLCIELSLNDLNAIISQSEKSIFFDTISMYKKGLQYAQIAEILHISRSCVIKYVKNGEKLGLCKYKSEHILHNAKFVYYEEKDIMFSSMTEAAKYFNVGIKKIRKMCEDGIIIRFAELN